MIAVSRSPTYGPRILPARPLTLMPLLAAYIVFHVGFALATRVSQVRGYDYFFVAAVNFVLAAAAAAVWAAGNGVWDLDAPTVIFGVVQGIQYAGTMVGIYLLLIRSGVGVTFILVRLSVVFPTLMSIVVFGEVPGPAGVVGLLLLLISIFLLAGPRWELNPVSRWLLLGSIFLLAGPRSEEQGPRAWYYWPLIFGFLVFTGIGVGASKVFTELSTPDRGPLFVVVAYAASLLTMLVVLPLRRRLQADAPALRQSLTSAGGVATGAAMGAANILQLVFLVAALQVVPGHVVFPIHASSVMVLTTLAGMVFWNERHGPSVMLGVAASVTGIVLVNV